MIWLGLLLVVLAWWIVSAIKSHAAVVAREALHVRQLAETRAQLDAVEIQAAEAAEAAEREPAESDEPDDRY